VPAAEGGQSVGCYLNNAKSVLLENTSAEALSGKGLSVREAATGFKVGKTALYEAPRADETRARVAVAGIRHTSDRSVC
jgi:transposase